MKSAGCHLLSRSAVHCGLCVVLCSALIMGVFAGLWPCKVIDLGQCFAKALRPQTGTACVSLAMFAWWSRWSSMMCVSVAQHSAAHPVHSFLTVLRAWVDQITKLKAQVTSAIGEGAGEVTMSSRSDHDRRFAKRLRVFGHVDFTVDSVIGYVLRLMYKTLYECIRLQTFSTNGYQQVQVDVAVFQLALPALVVRDVDVLEELLNEAVINASERCHAPSELESSVVFDIAQRKLEALGLL